MKYIASFLITVSSIIVPVSAVVIEVPPAWGNKDIAVTGPTRVQADESTLFEFIKLINEYLRFVMGAIALGILVYGGIKLITAQGDPEKLSSAHKLLLGATIGIVLIIFSYAIVRLIINIL